MLAYSLVVILTLLPVFMCCCFFVCFLLTFKAYRDSLGNVDFKINWSLSCCLSFIIMWWCTPEQGPFKNLSCCCAQGRSSSYTSGISESAETSMKSWAMFQMINLGRQTIKGCDFGHFSAVMFDRQVSNLVRGSLSALLKKEKVDLKHNCWTVFWKPLSWPDICSPQFNHDHFERVIVWKWTQCVPVEKLQNWDRSNLILMVLRVLPVTARCIEWKDLSEALCGFVGVSTCMCALALGLTKSENKTNYRSESTLNLHCYSVLSIQKRQNVTLIKVLLST